MTTDLESSIESTMDALDAYSKKARYRDLFVAIGTIATKANPVTSGEIAHAAGYCAPGIYKAIDRLTKALVEIGSPIRLRSKRINKQTLLYWLALEK